MLSNGTCINKKEFASSEAAFKNLILLLLKLPQLTQRKSIVKFTEHIMQMSCSN